MPVRLGISKRRAPALAVKERRRIVYVAPRDRKVAMRRYPLAQAPGVLAQSRGPPVVTYRLMVTKGYDIFRCRN